MSAIYQPMQNISPSEAKEKLAGDPPSLMLDVRNADEWEIGTVDGSLKISLPQIQAAAQQIAFFGKAADQTPLGQLPRDRDIIVYCHHGGRSAYAIDILREIGYDNNRLFNLEGGIDAWSAIIDPSIPRY